MFSFLEHEEKNTFEVSPGLTIEVTISQFWSNLGESNGNFLFYFILFLTILFFLVSAEIEFVGLETNVDPCVHDGNMRVQRIDVKSPAKFASIKPSIALKTLSISKKPSKSSLRQMPDNYRDKLWSGKVIHELILTYEFNVAESCKVAVSATSLNELLYDSPLESQFWMIFVSPTKEYKGCGDALGRYKVDLAEGNYTALLQLRTDDVDLLEKLKTMNVLIEYHLPKEINLEIYQDRVSSFLGGPSGKFSSKTLEPNNYVPLFVASPPQTSLPKQAVSGSTISGTLLWNKDQNSELKLTYNFIVPNISASTTPSPTPTPSSLTDEEQFTQNLLDNAITQLSNLVKQGKFESFDKLSRSDPLFGEGSKASTYLPYLQVCLEAEESRKVRSESSIIEAADKIINLIDSQKIAIYFGTKHTTQDPKMQQEKDQLINALYKKALSESVLLKDQKIEFAQLSKTLSELSKWVEPSDQKLIKFNVNLNQNKGLFALSHTELQKILSDPKVTPLERKSYLETQASLFEKLDWKIFLDDLRRSILVKYPQDYPIF